MRKKIIRTWKYILNGSGPGARGPRPQWGPGAKPLAFLPHAIAGALAFSCRIVNNTLMSETERHHAGSNQPVFSSTGPHGHRARMRERLLSRGPEALADYEVLEMLLFLGIPRRDTKPLAKELINRFGSLPAVLTASPEALAGQGGLGDDAVTVLRMPEAAAQRLAGAEPRSRPVLNNWDRLLEYFDTALAGATPGQLRALLLDNRNRLLADELVAGGAVAGEPDALPRLLAGRALALHATALILVRVVPAGPIEKALPKRDAALCAAVGKALGMLSITLHDHMLVGGGSWVSLRQKGLL